MIGIGRMAVGEKQEQDERQDNIEDHQEYLVFAKGRGGPVDHRLDDLATKGKHEDEAKDDLNHHDAEYDFIQDHDDRRLIFEFEEFHAGFHGWEGNRTGRLEVDRITGRL